MKSNPVSIYNPKREIRGEVIKAYGEPVTLGHPMHPSGTISFLYLQGGIELSYDLHIPIIVDAHEDLQVVALTSSNYLIINWIMLLLHIPPVNPLCL
jgi:hypothetical protein